MTTLDTPQRQSPWAPVFFFIATLRRIGVTQLVVFGVLIISGRLPTAILLAAPVLGLGLLAVSLARWWRFTFHVEDGSIIAHKGVVSTERLSIPFERVQSISVDQEFLHRPIGLVRVRIDTAGSSEAELDIAATTRAVATELEGLASVGRRDHTLDDATKNADDSAAEPGPTELIARRTVGELILIALTRRPLAGLALVLPAFAFAENLGDWFDVAGPNGDELDGAGGAALVLGLIGLALAVIAGLALLRVAGVVIRDHDVTLSRTADGLHRQAGLFDRRSEISRITRIQQVETSQGVLQRRANFTSLVLPTAGDSDSLRLLGARTGEIRRVRDMVLEPDTRVPSLERGIAPAAAFYWSRVPSVVIVLAAGVLAISWSPAALTLLVTLPAVWITASMRQRRFRWDLTDTGLALRQGVLTVSTTQLAQRRVQSVRIRRNLFERRRGLASVDVRTADRRVEIPMVDHDVALRLRDRLLATVVLDSRPWF